MSEFAYLPIINEPGLRVKVDAELLPELLQRNWRKGKGRGNAIQASDGRAAQATIAIAIMGRAPEGFVWARKNTEGEELDFTRANLELRPRTDYGLPKNISKHGGKYRVIVRWANKTYEKRGIKTLVEAKKTKKDFQAKAKEENPNWPPSRKGEWRGHDEQGKDRKKWPSRKNE